jgi:predicted alpha/beta superfamily hydrolase
MPALQQSEELYLAGSFNNWNPTNRQFIFQKGENGTYFIYFELKAGVYEYKITRGSWDKVECHKNGDDISNRILRADQDVNSEIIIEAWKDNLVKKFRLSTAGKNVQILDTAFYIPQLKSRRRIWIYLPAGYNKTTNRYPVLYMHDGQNVFEDTTAFSGEWGVDEALDSTGARQAIVVAIDNGGSKRLNEYSPYNMERYGQGEGKKYVDFIARTLKRYIDKKFRTLKGNEHTIIAGSSMGGLISMYAILRYPGVFGGAGIFSPSFWISPSIYDEIASKGKKFKGKIYFYAAKKESETMVPLMIKAFGAMAAVSHAKITTVVRDEGRHNENTWRQEFPIFYNWIIQ